MGEFKTVIGGQALLEGIMMRAPTRSAAVVRTPTGLVVREDENKPPRWKWLRAPFIRGVPGFVGSLRQGMVMLFWSAEFVPDEEENPATKDKAAKAAGNTDKNGDTADTGVVPEGEAATDAAPAPETVVTTDAEAPSHQELPKAAIAVSMLLAFALAIGLFTVLPTFLGGLLAPYIGSGFWRNLCETLLRLVVLLLYMFLVSRQKSIRRTFEYHGAEHKTIACYEAGDSLTVENVRRYSRFHPRCGTSFLLTVVIVSLFVFMLASSIFPFLPWGNPFLRVLFRLALLPIVVSVSYEFNRLIGRHDNPVTAFFRTPGLFLQRFTTIEPDDDVLEVGIHALKLVIPEEKGTDEW